MTYSIPLGEEDTIYFQSDYTRDKYAIEEYRFTYDQRLKRHLTGDIEQLTERQMLFAKQQNYRPITKNSCKWYYQSESTEKTVA